MTARKSIIIFFLLSLPVYSFAHAGHGLFQGSELAHYLTSFLHLIPTFAAIGVGIFLTRRSLKNTVYSPTKIDHARTIHSTKHSRNS